VIYSLCSLLFLLTDDVYFVSRMKCMWNFPIKRSYELNVLYNVLRTVFGFVIPLAIIMLCYIDLIRFMRKRRGVNGRKSVTKSKEF